MTEGAGLTFDLIIASILGLFSLLWIVEYLRAIVNIVSIPLFDEEDHPWPEKWPRLSVVVAARDEEDSIKKALTSLLDQDYPDLELVMVDDRSTDATGRVIDDLAGRDSRVKAVHVKELPPRWLGKVHALEVGTRRATGDWLLYTDGDIFFRKGILRKAVAGALAEKLDHLTLMPVPRTDSFWLEVVVLAFGILFARSTRAGRVGRDGSDAFVGIGAFNLVKKEALEKTEGFEWLRMEVVDDVGLGMMLQQSGARSSFAVAVGGIELTWYHSVGAMFKGLEKNLFGPMARYSLARMTIIVILLWAVTLAPVATLFYRGVPWLWAFGAAVGSLLFIGALYGKVKFGSRFLPQLLVPVGELIVSLMMLRSGLMCRLRGGIDWRGTKYSLKDLRAGQRVKL